MTAPKVGKKVPGSSTGRPIMVVLDMLGRRATLRIFWELRAAPLYMGPAMGQTELEVNEWARLKEDER